MPFDSLIRTRQINKPEISGYIVDVLLQYLKTGAVTGIATNTGQLTGQFYPLTNNPSRFITTGDITGLATKLEVTGNNAAILYSIDTSYYPRSNPSGYFGSGAAESGFLFRNRPNFFNTSDSGIQIYDIKNATKILEYSPNQTFILRTFSGSGLINFEPGLNSRPYISGIDVYTQLLNGQIALGSGDINSLFVSKDYFNSTKSLSFDYLSLTGTSFSSLLFDTENYIFVGARQGYPSEKFVIDLLGFSYLSYSQPSNRPFILGFNIDGGEIKSSGYNVLTTKDLTGLVSHSQLLSTSGDLDDTIWRVRTELLDYATGVSGVYQFTGVGGIEVYQSGSQIIVSGAANNFSGDGTYVKTSGTQTITGDKTFYDNLGKKVFRTISRAGYDFNNTLSIAWGARFLYDNLGNTILDWQNNYLKSSGLGITVDWGAGYLKSGANITLDWFNRVLSGGVWSVDGLMISGMKALTGAYLLTRGSQTYTGTLNLVSGNFTVSGKPVTTGGPYYPRSSNPSGYVTATGLAGASDSFDPEFFREISGTSIPSVIGIQIEYNGSTAPLLGGYRYILQVQGYKTGQMGRKVYSENLSSGYYDSPGNQDLNFNWNPIPGNNNPYILTIWSQTYGGGVPHGPFPTGAWATTMDDKNGINFSDLTWTSGRASLSPLGASDNWITFTGFQVRSIEVTGVRFTGNLKLSGIGGTYISTSGDFILVSGGAGDITGYVTQDQTGVLENKYLGLPTDGAYGGVNGPIAGVQAGDTHADAFDKVEVILGKLAPSKPLTLSQASFTISGASYSAYMQGTNTLFTSVVNRLKVTGYATGFYDADNGILSGYLNNTLTGIRTLSTGSDIGNFSGLIITNDFDYWLGVAGKAGFWSCLNAQITPLSTLKTGIFIMRMGHSTQGMTSAITGYCDTPLATSSTWTSSGTGACSTRIIDGIISLANTDPVKVNFNVTNGICAFYANPMAQLSCPQFASVNVAPTGLPMSGSILSLSGTITASNLVYTTGAAITLTTYNSASQTAATTTATNFRIDTISTQQAQRHTAGTGQFPSTNYNANYDNTTNLSGNEELQMLSGQIQNPPKINYGAFIPSGANYMSIQTGSFSGYRWAMFDMGAITTASNIRVSFNNALNFGASTIISGVLLYTRVSGATNGWIDGNAAYPGVGNPTNNSAPALVVASSNITGKVITFGTAALSGPVYIRVGLPSGSNKSFSSINMVTA